MLFNDKEELNEYARKAQKKMNLMVSMINTINKTPIPKILKKKGISIANRFHQDFSYRFKGEYKIDSKSSFEHTAYFCSILSKIAYEEEKRIINHLSNFFNGSKDEKEGIESFYPIYTTNKTYNTFLYVVKFKNSDLIFCCFRGSQTFSSVDWRTNFEMELLFPFEDVDKDLGIHKGMYKSLFEPGEDKETISQKLLFTLNKKLNFDPTKHRVILTGHSLGSGLASCFQIYCAIYNRLNIEGVFSYGGPRIGNKKFAEIDEEKCFRFINDLDFSPEVPPFMSLHGKEKIVTKYFSPEFQKKVRAKLPSFSFSLNDHLPGNYCKVVGKFYNFIVGEKNWKEFDKKKEEKPQRNLQIVLP